MNNIITKFQPLINLLEKEAGESRENSINFNASISKKWLAIHPCKFEENGLKAFYSVNFTDEDVDLPTLDATNNPSSQKPILEELEKLGFKFFGFDCNTLFDATKYLDNLEDRTILIKCEDVFTKQDYTKYSIKDLLNAESLGESKLPEELFEEFNNLKGELYDSHTSYYDDSVESSLKEEGFKSDFVFIDKDRGEKYYTQWSRITYKGELVATFCESGRWGYSKYANVFDKELFNKMNDIILSIVKPEKPWSNINFIDKNSFDDILDYVNIEGLNKKEYGG